MTGIWALWLVGCNRYDLFVTAGGPGEGRGNKADVLFVIDNSDSMFEESVALAENFGRFVQRLTGREAGISTDGLADAVDNYVDYVQDPALFVDYQLAITTTDSANDAGGLFGEVPILEKGVGDVQQAFVETLMCEVTCFSDRRLVPDDPGFVCGDPFEGAISRQYLDCLCGADVWVGNCGAGAEQPIEAVWNTMCRAVDDPPDECFEDSALRRTDAGSAAGFLRPDATFVPVIVSDEGDGSHRVANVQSIPGPYVELFALLDHPTAWAVIGPGLDEDFEVACPGLATSWGTLRFDYLVQATGGLRLDIHGEDCGPADWGTALDRLGDLIGGGVSAYRLPKEPVPGSIAVQVGRREIDEAEARGEDVFGQTAWGDGWTYRAEDRTVLLHGEAAPQPGEEVRIWYWPRAATR